MPTGNKSRARPIQDGKGPEHTAYKRRQEEATKNNQVKFERRHGSYLEQQYIDLMNQPRGAIVSGLRGAAHMLAQMFPCIDSCVKSPPDVRMLNYDWLDLMSLLKTKTYFARFASLCSASVVSSKTQAAAAAAPCALSGWDVCFFSSFRWIQVPILSLLIFYLVMSSQRLK